jgi:hypothetical protein
MPRNFSLGGKVTIGAIREPRVLMRAFIGLLLVANLVAAVIAFKPFGGSADDLRREQATLELQLTRLQARLAASKKLVEKVQSARTQGDGFLAKYFMDSRTASSQIDQELLKDAKESGIKQLPTSYEHEALEGSDTLEMVNITEGLEGTYENLTKFINLLDKSPRFLIVDGMQTAAPQQNGKLLSVQIKIHTFARADAGAAS